MTPTSHIRKTRGGVTIVRELEKLGPSDRTILLKEIGEMKGMVGRMSEKILAMEMRLLKMNDAG